MPWVLITSAREASNTKKVLEQRGLYDKKRKITKLANGEVSIPITTEEVTREADKEKYPFLRIEFTEMEQGLEKWKIPPHKKLEDNIRDLLSKYHIQLGGSFTTELPGCWEVHGDLVLLPEQSFKSKFWDQFGVELWSVTAASLGARRVAKKSAICNDNYRTPNVKLLLGDNGIVSHVDNKIKYTYDITKCMFSSGNVTEKIRIGKMSCMGETVVDLYAGIGYFVLPYLVHGKAALVHACEWNKHAVEALRQNVQLNGVENRCVIHEGDNRKFPHRGIADRVNLGLIPSSESGWPVACAVLRPDKGGWLHVHGNISSGLRTKGKKGEESCDGGEDTSDHAKVPGLVDKSLERQIDGPSTSNICQSKDGGMLRGSNALEMSDQNQSGTSVQRDSSGNAAGVCFLDTSDKNNALSDYEQVNNSSLLEQNNQETQLINDKASMSSKGNDEKKAVPQSEQSKLKTEKVGKLSPTTKGENTTGVNECRIEVPSCNKSIRKEWVDWAEYVVNSLRSLLCEAHCTSGVDDWNVSVGHLEHVKSYAPHISHLVLDVECRPLTENQKIVDAYDLS